MTKEQNKRDRAFNEWYENNVDPVHEETKVVARFAWYVQQAKIDRLEARISELERKLGYRKGIL